MEVERKPDAIAQQIQITEINMRIIGLWNLVVFNFVCYSNQHCALSFI